MGEIADMMLDGTLCECCGDYIGRDSKYPMRCSACGKPTVNPWAPRAIPTSKKRRRAKRARQQSRDR